MKGGAVYKDYKKLHPDTVFGEDIEIGPSIEGPEGFAGTHAWGSRGKKFIITTQAASNERKLDVILNLINDNAGDTEQATYLTYGVKDKHYFIDEASGNYVTNSDFFGEEKSSSRGIGTLTFGTDPNNRFIYSPKSMEFMNKYKTRGYEDGVYPTVESHAKYTNDLNRLALETYIDIITGKKDISEFDAFVKDFYTSGGQNIVDEINSEYAKMIGK